MSERKAGRLAELALEYPCSISITHYLCRYIDRTRQAEVSGLRIGEESAVLARGAAGAARRPAQGRAVVELRWSATARAGRKVTSSISRGGRKQLPVDTEAIFFGKLGRYRGARQIINPVVDLVAGVTPGPGPAHPPRLSRLGQDGPDACWEFGEWVEGGAAPGGRPL